MNKMTPASTAATPTPLPLSAQSAAASDLYQEDLLEEYRNLYGQGQLVHSDREGHEFNASCGDDMTVQLQLSADKTRVNQIKWQGAGCVISQVTMSRLARELEGKPLAWVQKLDEKYLLGLLGLPTIVSGRMKCLMLGLQAVRRAIKSVKS